MRMCRVVGLVPLTRQSILTRTVVWTVVAISVVTTFFCIKTSFQIPFKTPSRIVNLAHLVVNEIFLINCFLIGNIFLLKNWQKLFQTISKLEVASNHLNVEVTRSMWTFYLEVGILPAFCICINTCNGYYWISRKMYHVIITFILRPLVQLIVTLVVTLHVSLIQFVKKRYTCLDGYLRRVQCFRENYQAARIKQLTVLYRNIYEITEQMNALFGWHRFFCIAVAVSYWLDVTIHVIVHTGGLWSPFSLCINILHCGLYMVSSMNQYAKKEEANPWKKK